MRLVRPHSYTNKSKNAVTSQTQEEEDTRVKEAGDYLQKRERNYSRGREIKRKGGEMEFEEELNTIERRRLR